LHLYDLWWPFTHGNRYCTTMLWTYEHIRECLSISGPSPELYKLQTELETKQCVMAITHFHGDGAWLSSSCMQALADCAVIKPQPRPLQLLAALSKRVELNTETNRKLTGSLPSGGRDCSWIFDSSSSMTFMFDVFNENCNRYMTNARVFLHKSKLTRSSSIADKPRLAYARVAQFLHDQRDFSLWPPILLHSKNAHAVVNTVSHSHITPARCNTKRQWKEKTKDSWNKNVN